MPILGAHMSIAGGYYRAVDAAVAAGCDSVQLFTKNNNQWRAKPISDSDVEKFQTALRESSVAWPLSHSSYLINLAAPEEELWEKSRDAMVEELRRATLLGAFGVVLHPGAYKETDEATGLDRVVAALDTIHDELPDDKTARILLETTAGQGTTLGWQFEQLAYMLTHAEQGDRLGICFDTCHVFAAGYRLDGDHYEVTMQAFDETVGLKRIEAFHLNDSKKPHGSRVDRHEHIGAGEMGLDPFRRLMSDSRFADVPMYLETPKGDRDDGQTWDQHNLSVLRELVT